MKWNKNMKKDFLNFFFAVQEGYTLHRSINIDDLKMSTDIVIQRIFRIAEHVMVMQCIL